MKDDKDKLLVIETGVGLEFDIPEIDNPELRENFNSEKYYAFINNYQELPSNENIIKTWYHSDWEIKEIDYEDGTVILSKKSFQGIMTGFLGYSDMRGKNVSTLFKERLHISVIFGLSGFFPFLACNLHLS